MSGSDASRGRWAFGLTLAALVWGFALIVLAFFFPAYSGESSVSNGTTTVTHATSSTLVQENGLRVLIPLALPAAIAAIVWLALHRWCSRGSRWVRPLAWTAILPLAVFTLLTVVGIVILPMVVALATATTLSPRGPT